MKPNLTTFLTRIRRLTFFLFFQAFFPCLHAEVYFQHAPIAVNDLTSNDVLSVAQDNYGRIWIATEEGLNVYDGASFRHYYSPDTNTDGTAGIAGNALDCLLNDADNYVMWIGTQRHGLTAYDYRRGTFLNYPHKDSDPKSLSHSGVTSLVRAGKEHLWIGTYNGGVDLLDTSSGIITHYNTSTVKGMTSDRVSDFDSDGNGKLYVGHSLGGMTVIDTKTMTCATYSYERILGHHARDYQDVRAVHVAADGLVYLGTNDGLVRYSPTNRSFTLIPVRGISQPRVFDIIETSEGVLMVATEFNGVMRMEQSDDESSSRLTPLTDVGSPIRESSSQGVFKGSVRCLYEDRSGNIWTGMWGNGLSFINTRMPAFRYMQWKADHPGDNDVTWKSVLSVSTDAEGCLWIGTDGGGMNVFAGGKKKMVYDAAVTPLATDYIQALLADSHGGQWWGAYIGGAVLLRKGENRPVAVFSGADRTVDVRVIYEHPTLGILIGTQSGLYVADYSGHVLRHINVGNNFVRAMSTDGAGRLWLGLYDHGVVVLDTHFNTIDTIDEQNGLPSDVVNDLHLDQSGNMWIATNNGLVMAESANPRRLAIYQHSSGLTNTHIRAINEDNSGRIWVSTNKGIACVDGGKALSFGTRYGLKSGYFADRATTSMPDGMMFFGSTDGVCFFSPESVLSKPDAPHIVINSVQVLGPDDIPGRIIALLDGNKAQTSKKENNLQIGFNIDNLVITQHFDYYYRVLGIDETWHAVSTPGLITLRNMPSGRHTVEIGLRDTDRKLHSTAKLLIRVTPPFWLSWWAYCLYAALAVLLAWRIITAYKEFLRQKAERRIIDMQHEQENFLNNERLSFFTNITHELRTPLTMILGPLSDLEEDTSLPQTYARRIKTINDSAKRLLTLVNQLLDFRKTETQNKKLEVAMGNIATYVGEITLRYSELNRNPKLSYELHADVDDPMIYFDADIVATILNNLLNNASKYTPEGTVTVSLTDVHNDADYISLSVADTGCGIEPEALPHIFERYYQAKGRIHTSGTGIGLALVKNLADIHEAPISADSRMGQGSVFTVMFRRNYDYPQAIHKVATAALDDSRVDTTFATSDKEARPQLLVVEDNDEIREYIAQSFTDFDVLTATNGREGLEKAIDSVPDIIVSDIMMPELEGIDMCRLLKDDLRTSHIPIIMLTAKDSLSDKEEGYDSGADSYLTKPFSLRLLRSRILNLLESRRLLASVYMRQALDLPAVGNMKSSEGGDEALMPEPATGNTSVVPTAVTDAGLGMRDKKFLSQLIDVVNANIDSPTLDIGFLSSHFCMSTSTFYKKIKGVTGMSGNVFIRNMRLRHAAELMATTGASVAEAATASGFGDTNYFRQSFKKEYGISAAEYARKNQ